MSGQGNLTPSADLNIDNLPEGIDDDDNRDFDSAICREFVQLVDVETLLSDSQDVCWANKRKAAPNVAEAIELAKMLLQSADAGVHAVKLSEVPVSAIGDSSTLAAEFKKAKAPIVELESLDTITVRWHQEHLEEVKTHHAKKAKF